MSNGLFLRRLKKEMPGWVALGLLKESQARTIESHAASQGGGMTIRVSYAFYVMGVVLFGGGVVLYFAHNWAWMAKAVKLAILMGGLTLTYLLAGWADSRMTRPFLKEALLLLGVILFGANIFLIGQIYNISDHPPNAFLLWSLGGTVVAVLMGSQAALMAALPAGLVWSLWETNEAGGEVHWLFLAFWGVCLALAVRHRWVGAVHMGAGMLLVWMNVLADDLGKYFPGRHILPFYLLCYAVVFLAAKTWEDRLKDGWWGRLGELFIPLGRYYMGGLVMFSFWLLTFRQDGHRNETQMAWAGVVAYVAVAGAAWGLLAQLVRRKLEEARTGPNPYGDPRHEFMLLLGVLIPSFLLLTFQFLVHPEASQWMAGLFNLAFLLALVWMIYTGYLRQIPLLINTGFFLFAITLTARFVDTLWSLLARSYVMMFSGLVLLGLAFVLEKTRRGLLSRMGSPSGEVQ